jgi:sirohydrochlorin cobaltochelatase
LSAPSSVFNARPARGFFVPSWHFMQAASKIGLMSVAKVTPVWVEAGGNLLVSTAGFASSADATKVSPKIAVSAMAVNFVMVFIGKGCVVFADNLDIRHPKRQNVSTKKLLVDVPLAGKWQLRQSGRVNSGDFSDAALVVLGHGTTLNDQSAAPVFQHAAELRRRKIFAAVCEAFWKQEPHVKKVLAEISAPRVFIAPLFISEGYFSTQIIPKELGFDFPEILRLKTQNSELSYCSPVGSHDNMTKVILSRADDIAKNFPFPRAPKKSDITLFVAGHGTEKNGNSRKAIERQVELIRARKIYAEVHAIFLEEMPRISDCYLLAQTKNLVIIPFFISDGLHMQEDIPVLLGEAKRIVEQRLAAGQPTWRNPTEKNGKLVWYSPAVGSDPGMADVILERVREAVKYL